MLFISTFSDGLSMLSFLESVSVPEDIMEPGSQWQNIKCTMATVFFLWWVAWIWLARYLIDVPPVTVKNKPKINTLIQNK